MSTPTVGSIYAHPSLFGPRLYRVISVNDTHVILRPVAGRRRLLLEDTLNHFTAGCYTLIDPGVTDDELLAVARAAGVVVTDELSDEPIGYLPAGEQPAVEFTGGPETHGPLFSDEHLARVFFGGEPA